MAWCLTLQKKCADMLADGNVVSWRTLDLSPHAGIEWLMCGSSSVRASDLVIIYHLSQRVWEAVRGRMHVLPDDVIFDGDASERLADLLRFIANVAVGVGSGCSGPK